MSKKRYISYCPSNFICFLEDKGLLKKRLLFSERMKLEREFQEYCSKVIDDE
jgi:hypothetical protein